MPEVNKQEWSEVLCNLVLSVGGRLLAVRRQPPAVRRLAGWLSGGHQTVVCGRRLAVCWQPCPAVHRRLPTDWRSLGATSWLSVERLLIGCLSAAVGHLSAAISRQSVGSRQPAGQTSVGSWWWIGHPSALSQIFQQRNKYQHLSMPIARWMAENHVDWKSEYIINITNYYCNAHNGQPKGWIWGADIENADC